MTSSTVTEDSMPTAGQAAEWLARWHRQQEYYLADREERFAVIADVVATCGRPDPLIVDLGAGPGSLSVRLLRRLPLARVVAVDADPLLLGLARTADADLDGLTLVDHDLRDAAWGESLDLVRAPDAIVSTTALHWLIEAELAELYRTCASLLRPGGLLVNGDHLGEPAERPSLNILLGTVRDARAERVGLGRDEDWSEWWDAVGSAPELAGLLGERGARPIDHAVPAPPSVTDHLRLLHEAGFAEAGTVWQHGDDRVVVAVR